MAEPPTEVTKLDSGSSSSSISIEHINPKKIIEKLAAEHSGSNSAARASLINSNSTERQLVKKFVAEISHQQKVFDLSEMRKLDQFFVSLCGDVLSDVLRFGTRRRLAKLERIGRRFHRFIENFFYNTPFIHLDFELRGTKRNVKAAINGKIFTKKLATFDPNSQMAAIIELAKSPQFVRFNKVKLYYKSVGKIEEKCKMFVNYLHGIEAITLNGLNQIHFVFSISKKCLGSFSDHLQLLNYLRNELLPVCGTPRCYKFELSFNYDNRRNGIYVDVNMITQILQMDPIDRCSNIEIMLSGASALPMQWPIETISDWLHQKSEGNAKKSQKRFLKIYSDGWENFRNERELLDHLRETFDKAEIPSSPFHFEFCTHYSHYRMEMKEQELLNKTTNEAFWITKSKDDYNHDYTCIERFIVKKDGAGAISQKTWNA